MKREIIKLLCSLLLNGCDIAESTPFFAPVGWQAAPDNYQTNKGIVFRDILKTTVTPEKKPQVHLNQFTQYDEDQRNIRNLYGESLNDRFNHTESNTENKSKDFLSDRNPHAVTAHHLPMTVPNPLPLSPSIIEKLSLM